MDASRPDRRAGTLALFVLILCAGAALRFGGLEIQSLWRDEANTIHYASRETLWATLDWLIDHDVHPPLYDILLRFWMALFGDSVAATRALSALFGVVSIWLIERLGSAVAGRRVGLLAAFLQATALLPIYYSQEARSYAMLTTLAIASWDAFVRWRRAPGLSNAIYYLLATAALLYTHTFGLFVPLAQGVAMIALTRLPTPSSHLRARTGGMPGWLLLLACVVLLYSPWLPALMKQMRSPAKSWILEPGPGAIADTILMHLSLAKPPWNHPPPDWRRIAIAFAVTAPLLAGSALWLDRRNRPGRSGGDRPDGVVALSETLVIGLSWLLVPLASAWLASRTWSPIYTPRNLILCGPAVYLMLAATASRIRPSALSAILVALPVSFSAGNLVWYYTTIHKEDWRGAQRYIQENFRPTDQLVLTERGPLSWLPSRVYLEPEKLKSEHQPAIILDGEEPTGERLWTMTFRPRTYDEDLTRRGYRPVETREFHDGVTVVLYARPVASGDGSP